MTFPDLFRDWVKVSTNLAAVVFRQCHWSFADESSLQLLSRVLSRPLIEQPSAIKAISYRPVFFKKAFHAVDQHSLPLITR